MKPETDDTEAPKIPGTPCPEETCTTESRTGEALLSHLQTKHSK